MKSMQRREKERRIPCLKMPWGENKENLANPTRTGWTSGGKTANTVRASSAVRGVSQICRAMEICSSHLNIRRYNKSIRFVTTMTSQHACVCWHDSIVNNEWTEWTESTEWTEWTKRKLVLCARAKSEEQRVKSEEQRIVSCVFSVECERERRTSTCWRRRDKRWAHVEWSRGLPRAPDCPQRLRAFARGGTARGRSPSLHRTDWRLSRWAGAMGPSRPLPKKSFTIHNKYCILGYGSQIFLSSYTIHRWTIPVYEQGRMKTFYYIIIGEKFIWIAKVQNINDRGKAWDRVRKINQKNWINNFVNA